VNARCLILSRAVGTRFDLFILKGRKAELTWALVFVGVVGRHWVIATVRFELLLQPENEDELKKRQLMELALLNGTYRGFHGNGFHSNGNNILATRLNNNGIIAANNNHNNNNNIGLLMMTPAGPSFCE